jgi:quercetin dioxygenase-like cupin family protein
MHDAMRRRAMALMTSAVALLLGWRARADEPATGVALVGGMGRLLAGLHDPQLTSFLGDWPAASGPAPADARADAASGPLPVLRWLPALCAAAPRWSSSWVASLAAAAPSLAWRRSYSAAAVGEAFYENYGWTELPGLTGPVPSAHLACGVLILGPHVSYPAHRHEAEELYIPLVGMARWRRGKEAWTLRSPGDVIHHARHQAHAMQTGAEPLLALYLWRSENLAQSSQLDPAS